MGKLSRYKQRKIDLTPKKRLPASAWKCKKCPKWFYYPMKLYAHKLQHRPWRSWC